MKDYEIIDIHTHPFIKDSNNICNHAKYCGMSVENTVTYLKGLGISKICGSVILHDYKDMASDKSDWYVISELNEEALALKKRYRDFYVPGFHVHPAYVKESCDEIERMSKLGIRLIGELVPYRHHWHDYSCKEFDEILDVAVAYDMVVSLHTLGQDEMDEMVRKHPKNVFVAAHPGEYESFCRHLHRMELSENYYLDISGSGLFRHGILRHGIDEFGAERFLFGSDYPICNPAMYIGGVLLDSMITEEEKQMIFAGNAKRLLKL